MSKYFAKWVDPKNMTLVHYKSVDINIIENGLGWEFYFYIPGLKKQFGFACSYAEALQTAKSAIDGLHPRAR